jgi:hypothetical protein
MGRRGKTLASAVVTDDAASPGSTVSSLLRGRVNLLHQRGQVLAAGARPLSSEAREGRCLAAEILLSDVNQLDTTGMTT